jgi:hypothetical protein
MKSTLILHRRRANSNKYSYDNKTHLLHVSIHDIKDSDWRIRQNLKVIHVAWTQRAPSKQQINSSHWLDHSIDAKGSRGITS